MELYLEAFELSTAEQTDVKNLITKGTQIAMNECLSIWKRHNPSTATVRTLLNILKKLRKEEIALKVRRYCLLTAIYIMYVRI